MEKTIIYPAFLSSPYLHRLIWRKVQRRLPCVLFAGFVALSPDHPPTPSPPPSVITGWGGLVFETGSLVCVCKCEVGLEVHWFSVQSLSPKRVEVSAWWYLRSRQAQ